MHNPPETIPEASKFLKGTGESAWFYIESTEEKNIYIISRYTTAGKPECKNTFILQSEGFNLSEDYEMTFVSHCMKCTVIQNNTIYSFLKKT